MRISVNVRRVIQEIDLDTGLTSNFIVFQVGSMEHVVPATAEQLQEAIREARILQDAQETLEAEEKRSTATPPIGAVGQVPYTEPTTFVDDLVQEGYEDGEVEEAVQQAAEIFSDVGGYATEDELRTYRAPQDVPAADGFDASSDDMDEGGILAAVIAPPVRKKAAPTPTEQRAMNIGSVPHLRESDEKKKLRELKARAARLPKRYVGADEAGNPDVPQPKRGPTTVIAPLPSLPGLDEDGFEQG